MVYASPEFKEAMKQPVKELHPFLGCDGFSIRYDCDTLTNEGGLTSLKVSCESGLCKTAMRKLEAQYIGDHNLVGKWVTAGFGVKLASGAFDYIHYGSFLVSEQTISMDTGITSIVAYDKMVNAMTAYQPLDVEYPIDLFSYTQALCHACGLELGNTSFPVNGSWVIDKELYANIDGITYRDIFVQIAQATASTCVVGSDNKVYFKALTATGEQLTYANMLKLKLEPLYGEINSVALTRTPVTGEDVRMMDEESVAANEMTEFCIDNNEIIDKAREMAISPIFNALKGIKYYPFETATEGLGWYEIGDCFDIVNDAGEVMPTALFNFSITLDGGIKETLKATAETKTQTQYQYATSLAKRVKNTEIIVNKQDGTIQSLVSDIYDEGGVVNEKFTKITQDLESIVQSVQTSGGNNLIKNSVMFACDDNGKPLEWGMSTGGGGVTMQSDPEALNNGGISGHSFTLRNQAVRQDVRVKISTEAAPVCYTFSTRIKKGASGSCYVRVYNDLEAYDIELGNGDEAYYDEFALTGLHPKQNWYTVEIYADAQGATFTDNVLTEGEHKRQWSQASGEIMNTQVNVNVDGVLVRSSVFKGDYTVISPLEFAGYSFINNTPTKVFWLNKDVTYTKKLKAGDEIHMPPIKVVPILEGDLQGWAFVPST